MIAKITAAYIRHYHDNGQTTVYVEWADGSRTEAPAPTTNAHVLALIDRGVRAGLPFEYETW